MTENLNLEQFISSRRQAGATDNEIHSELQASGWDNTAISTALNRPNTLASPQQKDAGNKMLLPILALILVAAVALGWYYFQNSSGMLSSDSSQVTSNPNVSSNTVDPADSNENEDTYQPLTREESANKVPYVAAASDVEQIINAVHRYKAFQGKYPTSLQDMVNEKELTQEFIDRKHPAYTLVFSATNAEDCKVVATFSDGRVITSLCEDPNYHDQFTEFYDAES